MTAVLGPRPATRRATVVVTCLAVLLTTLEIGVVNVALPALAADLETSLSGVQWTVSGYALAFAALLLPAGSWSDRLGRRAVFLLGVGLFTTASVAAALSPSIWPLVLARVVQGAGGALVLATALALIAATHGPGRDRDRAIALFGAAGAVGVAVGPTVGGLLIALGTWPWIFWVNLPLGVAVVAATLVLLPEPPRAATSGPVDAVGAVLAAAGLFALNGALLAGPELGFGSPLVPGCLALGVVLLASFVVVARRRGRDALVDLRLFADRSFRTTMLLAFVLRVSTVGLMPFLVLWLQGIGRLDATASGLALLVLTVPVAVASLLADRVSAWCGAGRALALGFGALAAGGLALATLGPGAPWTAAIPAFLLLGTGSGLSFAPLMSTVVGAVPAERAGTAAGVTNTFLPLGSAAGVAVFGAVLDLRVGTSLEGSGADRAAHDAVVTGRLAELGPDLAGPGSAAFTAGLSTIALVVAALAGLGAAAALAGIGRGRAPTG